MPFSYQPEYDYTDRGVRHVKSNDHDDDVSIKGLTLGGLNESYDPDAQDGDGDGIVQEGTAFERPATPSTRDVTTLGSMPSAINAGRTGSTTGDVARSDNAPPYGIPRPVISVKPVKPRTATTTTRARIPITSRLRQRPSGVNKFKGKYGHPQRFKGMTAREIAEASVPDSPEAHLDMMVEYNVGSYEVWSIRNPDEPRSKYEEVRKRFRATLEDRYSEINAEALALRARYRSGQITDDEFKQEVEDKHLVLYDYSEEAKEAARKYIEETLNESPSFRWIVDNFGFPPTVFSIQDKTNDGKVIEYRFGGYFRSSQGTMLLSRPYFEDIKGKDRITLQSRSSLDERGRKWLVDGTATGTIRHEYGHYLAYMAAKHLDGLYADREDMDMFADYDYRFNAVDIANNFTSPVSGRDMRFATDTNQPYVDSAYGQQNMQEMWAEGFTAYTEPKDRLRSLLSPQLEKMLDAVVGVDPKSRPWKSESSMDPLIPSAKKPSAGFSSRRNAQRAADDVVSRSEIAPKEMSIMDWDRPVKHQVGANEFGETVHRFTLGDYSFEWTDEFDPADNDYSEKATKAILEHLDTSSFNGAVRHEGDAWFNRQISALLFGYQIAPPEFRHYDWRIGQWDKEVNSEFDAILTGDVAKYDEYDRESIQFAIERAVSVMQGVADSKISEEPKWRLVKDPEGMAVGDVIPIPLTNVADRVDDIRIPTAGEDFLVMGGELGKGSAILKIVGPHYSGGNGTESVTQGNFRIKRIYVNDRGNKVIEMEQIDVYSPRDNAFKTVPTQGQIAMRELGSAYPINISVKDPE
jgi:hypothetical protein